MTEPNFQSGVDTGRRRAASAPVLMPGISVYADLRRENYAYVDKTRELKRLLDSGKFLFLARPRRFGKTLMLSTIECMHQGDWPEIRDPFVEMAHPVAKVPDELLFTDTAWEEWVATSPKRPVIRLDLSAVTGNDATEMKRSLTRHVARQALAWWCRGLDPGIELQYLRDATGYSDPPQDMLANSCCGRLQRSKVEIRSCTGGRVRHATPEAFWAAVLPRLNRTSNCSRISSACSRHCESRFAQGAHHRHHALGVRGRCSQALNNLQDCTWNAESGAVCGFTESQPGPSPRWRTASKQRRTAWACQSNDQLRRTLKRENYKGYQFDPDGIGPAVYNPWSLCNALADLLDSAGTSPDPTPGFSGPLVGFRGVQGPGGRAAPTAGRSQLNPVWRP